MKSQEFRALRKRLGWSQEAIADGFGTTQVSVSLFERGVRQNPQWNVVEAAYAMQTALQGFDGSLVMLDTRGGGGAGLGGGESGGESSGGYGGGGMDDEIPFFREDR